MNLSSLYNNSYTHTFFITFFIYLQRTAEERKHSPSPPAEAQNTMDAPRPIGFAAAAPPLLSIFLQHPRDNQHVC